MSIYLHSHSHLRAQALFPLHDTLDEKFDIYMLREGFIGESDVVWANSLLAIWRIGGEACVPVALSPCRKCEPQALI